MKKILLWVFGGFWLLLMGFYLFHSSIWGTARGGTVKMIANGNIYQPYDRTGLGPDDCMATRIVDKETKPILQNTVHAIRAAVEAKAEISLETTSGGNVSIFQGVGCGYFCWKRARKATSVRCWRREASSAMPFSSPGTKNASWQYRWARWWRQA